MTLVFNPVFFASQATSEPTTILLVVEASQATSLTTTVAEVGASQATSEPTSTVAEIEASQATSKTTTTVAEDNIVRECWTNWFDRDDPSGSGDWEILSWFRRDNPGQICPKPTAVEAQTLSGQSVAAAGDVIYKNDPTTGFVCRNQDQRNNKMCKDYRVRFSCPPSFCGIEECWTKWFDQDDPSGSGDWEILSWFRIDNPGQICPKPTAVEAQTLSGQSVAAAGDVIYKNDPTTGFVCRNRDQHDNKMCKDYRVRFSCPPSFCDVQASQPTSFTTILPVVEASQSTSFITILPVVEASQSISFITIPPEVEGNIVRDCWTQWFNRDNPSGSGDWEIMSWHRRENPGKICPNPTAIEAQTLSGQSVAAAGDVIYRSDTTGFICRNLDQRNYKMCKDYRVRFSCPPSFCGGKVCRTGWYDRDNPSGSGDWELLSNLRKENPGQICKNPLFLKAVTTDTNTPAKFTRDVIYISDPSKGFVCRNNDQKGRRRCRDYKVQFGCKC
ncbi:mucin-5AC-like [Clinocottus analis]|uniref:mucin-5AC-like n=1 Tax=Clinocottus analis TaxID=304258 RepID=UPI0035C24ABF